MHRINSSYSMDETIDKTEKALIPYGFNTLGMFGFLGKVDRENKSFWIVNHSNIYKTRKGYKYRTYRRFKGAFTESLNGVTVTGVFETRPLFKIWHSLYFVLLTAFALFGLIFSPDLVSTLKLIAVLVLMFAGGIGVIRFKLKSTEPSEGEIISYIEEIFVENKE